MVYDGLGNPVGRLGFEIPIVSDLVRGATNLVRGVASNIPIVGGLVNSLLPGSPPPPAAPALPFPTEPSIVSRALQAAGVYPGGSPFPTAPMAPWPYRWIRPQGPLMAGHRRLYLRCTAWPGPEGLVPVDATTTGLLPPPPGAPMPGTPAGPVFHHRRHRRRR
jgi:hypothetical protein